MMARDPALQIFLDRLYDALASSDLERDGTAAVDRIYAALIEPGHPGARAPQRLPVCDEALPVAYATARRHAPMLAGLVDSFANLEPTLRWAPRSTSGPHASANWPDGHANATVVGPGGIENRNDMQIGVSLLARNVRYPDHNHAPEEVYLVLSPGRFQHGETAWFEPGIGGTLYNVPNIRHAMASGDAPLFAIWLLWAGAPPAPRPS